ncbi:MAG: sigma-70 family RNA polymerase sigma factor [Patescibacteria group bacterium]|jgi:RNA polymerase sigma-70 factor (ECF subfamily)
MNNYSDEQLVEAYLKGNKESLNILIRRYLTPVFNYVLSFVKENNIAEDLTQEVFVKIWKKIKKFDNKYKFKSWLYIIAKNTCLDYLKKNRSINFSELNLVDDNLLFENLLKENSASPQIEFEIAQEDIVLNDAVDKLPEKYRETVKLHFQGGYNFREIAEILKISIETVKSRNRRALIWLRKFIKGE